MYTSIHTYTVFVHVPSAALVTTSSGTFSSVLNFAMERRSGNPEAMEKVKADVGEAGRAAATNNESSVVEIFIVCVVVVDVCCVVVRIILYLIVQ